MKQRLEGGEGVSHDPWWEKSFLGRGQSATKACSLGAHERLSYLMRSALFLQHIFSQEGTLLSPVQKSLWWISGTTDPGVPMDDVSISSLILVPSVLASFSGEG